MPTDHLPTPATPFIGRTHELAEISHLLADPNCRLLTLVGPGGIGKTRLALEAARSLSFRNSVYFVPLQPLASPDLIVSAIAEAIQFQFYSGGEPKQQLLDYLREKALLLVLDNFEHLLDGAEFVSDMLAFAPGLKVLTTSREALNLQEEWVYPATGLRFPDASAGESLEDYSAVRLFVQSARRMRADFALADEQAGVIRICQLVEGMPLGIELAAAWVRALSCAEIADEIERSLDILATATRNVPTRHRNMRAVVEHSWTLLTANERAVFKHLSVFRGGFRKEAAQAVAGATLPTLSALVDKSLLRAYANGRYDVHELLVQYGEEKLKNDLSEDAQTRERHSVFYADFLSEREHDLKGRRQAAALHEITADFENVCATWNWAVAQKKYGRINQMIESLCLYCEMRSRFHEGQELFRHAQEQLASDPSDEAKRTWGRVSVRWVEMWHLQERVPQSYEPIKQQVESGLAIARKYEDRAEVAFCLWLLGILAFTAGDFAGASAPFEEGFVLYSDLDDRYRIAKIADFLAANWGWQGQYERYLALTQQSVDLRREIGDQYGLASSLYNLAHDAFQTGKYEESEVYLREMDTIYLEIGSEARLARNRALRAQIAFYKGNFEEAKALAQKAATVGWEVAKLEAVMALSLLATMEGDYTAARRLAGSISVIHDPYVQQALAFALCGMAEDQAAKDYILMLLQSRFAAVYTGMSIKTLPIAVILLVREGEPEQAVEVLALALSYPASATGWMEKWSLLAQTRAELEAELPPEIFTAAWERGKARSLAEVVNGLIQRWQPAADAGQPSAAQTANRSLLEPLSERELEVLHLIAAGSSNQEIAAQLVIGVSTVKKHINHLFAKLGVESRMQALVRARALNLL